jgi:hypothetical protein
MSQFKQCIYYKEHEKLLKMPCNNCKYCEVKIPEEELK